MKYNKLKQVFSLLTCILMLLAVAINRNQKVLGYELNNKYNDKAISTEQKKNDGTIVISTMEIAKDIMGYGGNTPLEISLKDGIVTEIKTLRNAETLEFFTKLKDNNFFSQWIGLRIDDALQVKVDAVSGATLSSNAIIETLKRGLEYAKDKKMDAVIDYRIDFSPKLLCTIIVILMGSILPLFLHFRHYRLVQLILNTIILGFWSGCFISYSLLVNYLSNGLNIATSLVSVLLLIIAFIFPLFGRKSHYCSWICPLGSLQELVGKSIKYKWRISTRLLQYLNYFREGLWVVLMLCLWSGVLFSWMDYELFTAFLFQQASVVVIIVAIVFTLLSCVVARPYCRFVCPTGNLLRISQNNK